MVSKYSLRLGALVIACGALIAGALLLFENGAQSARSAQAGYSVTLNPVQRSDDVTSDGFKASNSNSSVQQGNDEASVNTELLTVTNNSGGAGDVVATLIRHQGDQVSTFDDTKLVVTEDKQKRNDQGYTMTRDGRLEFTAYGLQPGESSSWQVSAVPDGFDIDQGQNLSQLITAQVTSVNGEAVAGEADSDRQVIPAGQISAVIPQADGDLAFHINSGAAPITSAIQIVAEDGTVLAEGTDNSASTDPVLIVHPVNAAAAARLSSNQIAHTAGFFDTLKKFGSVALSSAKECAKTAVSGFMGSQDGKSGGLIGSLCSQGGGLARGLLESKF